jgi:hypothetical protein
MWLGKVEVSYWQGQGWRVDEGHLLMTQAKRERLVALKKA